MAQVHVHLEPSYNSCIVHDNFEPHFLQVRTVYLAVYKQFIEAVDAIDNGEHEYYWEKSPSLKLSCSCLVVIH